MVELNNFYYLFGTNTHLLNKYKKLFLLKKERDNYTIEYLKESLPNPIFNFFTDKTLYLLDPSDFNDDQLLSWLDTLDQTYVLFTSNKRCDFLIKKLKSGYGYLKVNQNAIQSYSSIHLLPPIHYFHLSFSTFTSYSHT